MPRGDRLVASCDVLGEVRPHDFVQPARGKSIRTLLVISKVNNGPIAWTRAQRQRVLVRVCQESHINSAQEEI